MSTGVGGLPELGDQPVSQMNHSANLRRNNPDSAGVEFIPLNKRRRSSVSMKDNMVRNTSGIFDKEKYRKQLLELKHYSEGLQSLTQNTSKQVAHLCRIISKMQSTEEEESLQNQAIPTAEERSLANTPEMMGNHSMDLDTASSSVHIHPNLGMREIAENGQENNREAMNCPTSLINGSGQCSSSLSICLPPKMVKAETNPRENIQMVKAETNPRENIQVMSNAPLLGNNNGQDSPRVVMHCNVDSHTEVRSETVIYPTSTVENGSVQATDTTSFIITPSYELLPFGILVKTNGMGNSSGTMISPTVLKNDNSHGSSLSPDSISPHIGYLGNPERNVTILKMHLMNAQRKPEPKHAARYLARVLFSKEVLVCSSVGASPSLPNLRNRQPLDPNKLAAIREFLATVFPNCDLHENGKEWRTCLNYISALIRYLGSTVRGKPEIVVTTNPNVQPSANLNSNRDGDGGEGSSQLSQQAAVSEARARGNYQPNSSAVPGGVEKPSTSDLPIPCGALDYIGNPSRNIKLSHSVLLIAKRKASPEMSARYLMSHLFPEEILLKSDVCGNLWHSIYAVNFNKINALREFLQDVFPKCDLSENGREWKMCMHSINCCIGSYKGGHGNLTCESLLPEVITTTVKSESSDTTDCSD